MISSMSLEKVLKEELRIKNEEDISLAILQYASENKGKKLNKNEKIQVGEEIIILPYTVIIDENGNPYARYDRDNQDGFVAGQGAMGKVEYVFDLRNHERIIMKTQALMDKDAILKSPDFSSSYVKFIESKTKDEHIKAEDFLKIYLNNKLSKIKSEMEMSKEVGLSQGACIIKDTEDLFEIYEFQKPAGIPLSRAAKEYDLSSSDMLDIMISAFENLQLIQRAGIVHGDIKYDNILVMQDPSTHKFKATIIDFGEAQRQSPDVPLGDRPLDLKLLAFNFLDFFNLKFETKPLKEKINHLKNEQACLRILNLQPPSIEEMKKALLILYSEEFNSQDKLPDLSKYHYLDYWNLLCKKSQAYFNWPSKPVPLFQKNKEIKNKVNELSIELNNLDKEYKALNEALSQKKTELIYPKIDEILQSLTKYGNSSLSVEAEIALNKLKIVRVAKELLKPGSSSETKSLYEALKQRHQLLVEQQRLEKEALEKQRLEREALEKQKLEKEALAKKQALEKQEQKKLSSEASVNNSKISKVESYFSKLSKSPSKLSILPTDKSSSKITQEQLGKSTSFLARIRKKPLTAEKLQPSTSDTAAPSPEVTTEPINKSMSFLSKFRQKPLTAKKTSLQKPDAKPPRP